MRMGLREANQHFSRAVKAVKSGNCHSHSSSAEQSLPEKLPRELVDVTGVTVLAASDRDDDDDDFSPGDSVDDAVALADRPDAAEAGQLADQWLALLLRRFRELIDALSD
jgi:hypothetical protein